MSKTINIGEDSLSKGVIKHTIELACKDIEKLKKSRTVGTGKFGSVYEWCIIPNKCDYVVKISRERNPDRFDDPKNRTEFVKLVQMERMIERCVTNVLHKHNLAPKVYAMRYCPSEKVFLTIMDKISGDTLSTLLGKKLFQSEDLKKLIKVLRKLHMSGIYHGDLNPSNVFYDGKSFKFIDITYAETGYKHYYDYLSLVYYISRYINLGYPLMIKFINMLLKAANKDAQMLGVKLDKCLEHINTLVLELQTETNIRDILEKIANYITNIIIFEPATCEVIYYSKSPDNYIDMINKN